MNTPHSDERVGETKKSGRTSRGERESSARLARVLRLVALLSEGRPVPIPRIARSFNVSPRTVSRDVKFLRDFGFDIETTPQGYCLERSSFSLPSLDEKEIEALGVLQRFLDCCEWRFPLADNAAQAIRRLFSLLSPNRKAEDTGGRFLTFWFEPSSLSDHHSRLLRSLYRIINARKACEVDLKVLSHKSSHEKFRCVPLHLECAFGGWQVYGLNESEDRMVAFPLTRIEKLGRPCQPRNADQINSLRERARAALDRSRASNTYNVVLRIYSLDRNVPAPLDWHPLQEQQSQDSEETVIRFPSMVDDHLVEQILRFGPAVEVLEPYFLREHISRIARQLAEQYGSGRSTAKTELWAPFRFRTSVQRFRALRVTPSRAC